MRVQFELTAKNATSRLPGITEDANTSLAKHETEIKRLDGLLDMHRSRIRLDTFNTTIGNAGLQRDLTGGSPPDIERAIKSDNDFLQVIKYTSAHQHVRGVAEEE